MGAVAVWKEPVLILIPCGRLLVSPAKTSLAPQPEAWASLFLYFPPVDKFLFFYSSYRETNRKSAAFPQLAINRDRALEIIFNNFFDYAKTETHVFTVFGLGGK